MTPTPETKVESVTVKREYIDRATAIKRIKAGLERRSGKRWSVTGGRGTAYGWLVINAPPARRTAHYVQRPGTAGNPQDFDYLDTGEPNGNLTPADQAELAKLLDLDHAHLQGVNVPASNDYYWEFIDRAEGRTPAKLAQAYWD